MNQRTDTAMTAEIERYGLHKKLDEKLPARAGDSIYALAAGGIAIALSGLVAYLFKEPLLFPSLGPTVFLVVEKPMSISASPRNTITGHFLAIIIGFGCLAIFGLVGAPSALHTGMTAAHIGAAALAVALTNGLLILFDVPHPPSGATVLIITLGLLATIHDAFMLAAGIALVTGAAWIMNRLLGVPVPFWSPKPGARQ